MEFFEIRPDGQPIWFPDLPHHVPQHIKGAGDYYERDLLDHLRRTVGHGGTWVDVGANIGNHSTFFALNTADRVISIEPHPENCAALRGTVERNGLSRVQVIQSAAGDTIGTVGLMLPPEHTNNPASFRVDPAGDVLVPIAPLDKLLEGIDQIRLLKIDVEGHEAAVLRGASQVLARYRPHLVAEAHTDADLAAIRAIVGRRYRLVGRFCSSPTYHLAPWSPWRHLLFRLRRKTRHLLASRLRSG